MNGDDLVYAGADDDSNDTLGGGVGNEDTLNLQFFNTEFTPLAGVVSAASQTTQGGEAGVRTVIVCSSSASPSLT